MKLNEKIAYYRRQGKLSQEELAARVGVSRQAVSKWELGEASPDIGRLMALAQAFGAQGVRATDLAQLDAALEQAFAGKGPFLIECLIDKDEFVLPMLPPGGSMDDIIVKVGD